MAWLCLCFQPKGFVNDPDQGWLPLIITLKMHSPVSGSHHVIISE
jgi:hypothetical protein